jgi:thiol-disulfide isomerase/thioredoxin
MSRDEGFILVFCIILALTLVLVIAWLVELTKQQGRILARVQALEERHPMGILHPGAIKRHTAQIGLPVGARAPAFSLVDLGGSAVTLSDVLAKGPGMLFFSNPNCGPCAGLMPDVARWQEEYRDSVSIFVISEGTIEANRRKDGVNVLLQREREVAEAYQAWGTPAAVIVSADGTIATALAQGRDAIVDSLKGWLSVHVSATDFVTT